MPHLKPGEDESYNHGPVDIRVEISKPKDVKMAKATVVVSTANLGTKEVELVADEKKSEVRRFSNVTKIKNKGPTVIEVM